MELANIQVVKHLCRVTCSLQRIYDLLTWSSGILWGWYLQTIWSDDLTFSIILWSFSLHTSASYFIQSFKHWFSHTGQSFSQSFFLFKDSTRKCNYFVLPVHCFWRKDFHGVLSGTAVQASLILWKCQYPRGNNWSGSLGKRGGISSLSLSLEELHSTALWCCAAAKSCTGWLNFFKRKHALGNTLAFSYMHIGCV